MKLRTTANRTEIAFSVNRPLCSDNSGKLFGGKVNKSNKSTISAFVGGAKGSKAITEMHGRRSTKEFGGAKPPLSKKFCDNY